MRISDWSSDVCSSDLGGLVGVIVVLLLFARKHGKTLFEIGDFIARMIPLGLAAGRLGNFINGELWGRPTTVPWGMVFPQAGDGLARHPSQLYEMGLEGFVLFALVWRSEEHTYELQSLMRVSFAVF